MSYLVIKCSKCSIACSAKRTKAKPRCTPNFLIQVGTSLPMVGVTCPAFLPEAPEPQKPCSTRATSTPFSRNRRAAHKPVYPPPTITTSQRSAPCRDGWILLGGVNQNEPSTKG